MKEIVRLCALVSNEIIYIANDARCQVAIEDLNSGIETLKWLGQYLDFYVNVTYAPGNSPRVIYCNCMDKHYK